MSAAEKRVGPMGSCDLAWHPHWETQCCENWKTGEPLPEPSPPPEFAPCVPSLQRKCETEKMSDFERDYPWGGVESPDSTTGLGIQRLSSGNISQGGTDDVKPSPRLTCEPSLPSAAPPKIADDPFIAVHSMLVRAEAGILDNQTLVKELTQLEELLERVAPQPAPNPDEKKP